eukprot:3566866-Prymnesium_polylepis.2
MARIAHHRSGMPPALKSPAHIQELAKLPGIGSRKRKLLGDAFRTEEALHAATEENLVAVKGVGPKAAKLVRDFCQYGQVPTWRGNQHAVMWDTKRKKKLAGVAAPLDNEAAMAEWLANREDGRYERYVGQDGSQADALHVPETARMPVEAYK